MWSSDTVMMLLNSVGVALVLAAFVWRLGKGSWEDNFKDYEQRI